MMSDLVVTHQCEACLRKTNEDLREPIEFSNLILATSECESAGGGKHHWKSIKSKGQSLLQITYFVFS